MHMCFVDDKYSAHCTYDGTWQWRALHDWLRMVVHVVLVKGSSHGEDNNCLKPPTTYPAHGIPMISPIFCQQKQTTLASTVKNIQTEGSNFPKISSLPREILVRNVGNKGMG